MRGSEGVVRRGKAARPWSSMRSASAMEVIVIDPRADPVRDLPGQADASDARILIRPDADRPGWSVDA
jgi:hypothetical protein